jgi:lipid-binding SYLF domain-containing protein
MSRTLIGAITIACILIGSRPAVAADKAEIDRDAHAALSALYASVPAAKELGAKAAAILVLPKITKAGLGIGGLYGDGALIKNGKSVAYYNTSGGSFGLQAGVQTTTAKDDIYAFVFGQKGLMAGIGIQGNKITKINPK